jgi:hypothetical protein
VAAVAGNHEHGALGLTSLEWFNPLAKAAALWTRDRLDQDHSRYLGALPLSRTFEEATLVHASPRLCEWDQRRPARHGEAGGGFHGDSRLGRAS